MELENIQETIREYLEGTMTVQDKTDFEAEIKKSKELAEQVKEVRLLRIFNKNKQLIEAKALLDSVMADIPFEPDYGTYEKHFKESLFDRLGFKGLLLSGLAIVLLIGGATVFYQKNQDAKALIELSKTHLKPLENLIGFSASDLSREAKAMQAYDNKNYSEAIKQLNNILKNGLNDNSLSLYLGISYLMEGQNVEAETQLKTIIQSKDVLGVPAKWYLALSLMQRGEKEEAKALLQNLETDSTFGNQATELLKKW